MEKVKCLCRKGAIWPQCPVHGIGKKRYIANLVGLVCVVATVAFALFTAPAKSSARPVPLIICDVWGQRCGEALAVSYCESRWNTDAKNGQYKGLFQVSGWWRRTVPGWGPSAFQQAVHAFRVFKKTGSNWSQWECQP